MAKKSISITITIFVKKLILKCSIEVVIENASD
jgi:hypothetical protein